LELLTTYYNNGTGVALTTDRDFTLMIVINLAARAAGNLTYPLQMPDAKQVLEAAAPGTFY
jgi:hypothetical protein